MLYRVFRITSDDSETGYVYKLHEVITDHNGEVIDYWPCSAQPKGGNTAELERDQLRAALQRFMELDPDDIDVTTDLWGVQHDLSGVDFILATHDAEVIERLIQTVRPRHGGDKLIPLSALADYANQLRQQAK